MLAPKINFIKATKHTKRRENASNSQQAALVVDAGLKCLFNILQEIIKEKTKDKRIMSIFYGYVRS
jgi:hypothetical protein